MNYEQAGKIYQRNFSQWFEIGNYSFLFKKMTEGDKSGLFIAQSNDYDYEDIQAEYFNMIYSCIIDWKNVKQKDILDIEDEDGNLEIDGFSKEAFDLFLKKNMHLVQELFDCIGILQNNYDKYRNKRFEQMKKDLDLIEEAKIYEEVSKFQRKKINVSYETTRSISIFNRSYEGMNGSINWDYVLFWADQLGVTDVETECEMMLLIRSENSKQDEKKEDRKKEIKAKCEELDILLARKFSTGDR